MSVDDGTNAGYFGLLWPAASVYSSGFESPIQQDDGLPYYAQSLATGPHEFCNPSFYDGYTRPGSSRSPGSVGSSTEFWGQDHDLQASGYVACLESSPESISSYDHRFGSCGNIFGDQHWVPTLLNGRSRLISPDDRDSMELDPLDLPSTRDHTPCDMSVAGAVSYEDDAYLAAYWRWVHPLFPILHRSSFSLPHTSPLLRAAILALGAHSQRSSSALYWGRIVHERCLKVLKNVRPHLYTRKSPIIH